MVNVKNTFTLEEHGLLAYFVRIFFNADRKNLFCKKRGLKYRVKILDCQASRRMESLLEVWEVNFRMTDSRIQVRWRGSADWRMYSVRWDLLADRQENTRLWTEGQLEVQRGDCEGVN